jgi:tRNA threonylcarbamoyladenosine biosynthesis protein TsaE
MQFEIVSCNPSSTSRIGSIFSRILRFGDTVLLTGELGAGKTTFIAGCAQRFKIGSQISSPSFTILNVYSIKGRRKFVHADLYRLDSIDEVLNIGLQDYIYDKNAIVFIEWGDRILDYFKTPYIEIGFEYLLSDEQARKIVFKSSSRYWDNKIEIFKDSLKKCKSLE